MRIYTLILEIINLLSMIKVKIAKLNYYWRINRTFTVTASNVNTNHTVVSAAAYAMHNALIIDVTWTAKAQIATGTSVKRNLCTLTITDPTGGWVKSGNSLYAINGTLGSAGPICTGRIGSVTRVSDTEWTVVVYICGTAGGAIPANTNMMFRFYTFWSRDPAFGQSS